MKYVRNTKMKRTTMQRKRCIFRFAFLPALFVTVILILVLLMTESIPTLAEADSREQGKFYKSITIQKGDTLWDLASEYMTDDYASVAEYVTVLKELNHLQGEKILAGNKLIVVYSDINND